MKILFDQGTPVPLRKELVGHAVETAFERGWGDVSNGELLQMAEEEGFEALVTTDQNLKYQQNLSTRRIAIVVLLSTSWPRIKKISPLIASKIGSLRPTDYIEISVPG